MTPRDVSSKPIIGVTCFYLTTPCARSAVNQQYVDAIAAAGGAPILIPVGVDELAIDRIYSILDGLLLPGGDDVAPEHYRETAHPHLGEVDPLRDDLELTLTRRALDDDLPILGVCRGIQLLAVAAGGTLYQDLPTELDSITRHEVREFGRDHLAHAIAIEPGSRLGAMLGESTTRVNSFHHQAVRDVPKGFLVSARSSDGVVEAIEGIGDRYAVGVQCHPEEMWAASAPEFARLFSGFVDAAAQHSLALRSTA